MFNIKRHKKLTAAGLLYRNLDPEFSVQWSGYNWIEREAGASPYLSRRSEAWRVRLYVIGADSEMTLLHVRETRVVEQRVESVKAAARAASRAATRQEHD